MGRLIQSLARRGVAGTTRLFVQKALNITTYASPAARKARAVARLRDLELDRTYGLDTDGTDRPPRSDACGDNWPYGHRYAGIDRDACTRTLTDLGIRYEDFTFLDLGSGKGRALLLASAFPFRRIIGVEFSRTLHEVAEQNLLRYPQSARQCHHIETHWGDAAAFDLPDGPLVLFLYNPFGAPVMKKVIEHVTASFARRHQRIIVIYFCSEHADLWDAVPFLRRTRAGTWPALYDTDAALADRKLPDPTAALPQAG